MKTPTALEALQFEVRSHFKSYDDIDAASAARLPFLQAVINEALRIQPAGSQGFPRISPGVVIDGRYIPPGVSCPARNECMHSNRRIRKLTIHQGRGFYELLDCHS